MWCSSCIYLVGTLVGLFTILHLVSGGWHTIHAAAASAGKFRVFDFTPDFYRTYTFWSGVIGGAFLTTASHGTDQLIVQRLLAARSEAQSKLALLSSGVAVFFQFSLFLLIGAMLWVFYRISPPTLPFDKTDRIFPTFIVTYMPHGISGILIAAILAAAMSNLSAALNSLSSTTMVDFYLRRRPDTPERRRVLLSRLATIAWGLVLFGLAILSRRGGKVVELGLSIASVAYGALLGVFLLGVLTRRANERGSMIGMAIGFCANVYIWQGAAVLQWLQRLTGAPFASLALSRPIPFPWYVLIGSAITFAVGYSSSLLLTSPDDTAHGTSSNSHGHAPTLSRDLGVSHATALVVGTLIGSGIFLVPAEMMQAVGSAGLVYLAWIVGGLLSFAGALTYAELGAMKPQAGGEYVYIRDAYGPLPGFLYAWTTFAISKPASVATITTGLVRSRTFPALAFLNEAAMRSPFLISYGNSLRSLPRPLSPG